MAFLSYSNFGNPRGEFVDNVRDAVKLLDNRQVGFEYEGEMHTLGNLLATNGLEQLSGDDFIGYRIVHPMMDKFIMRMKLANSKSKDEHIDRLAQICKNIETQVDEMLKSWNSL